MAMVLVPLTHDVHAMVGYLSPTSNWDYLLVSAQPKEKPNLTTLFNVMDWHTWILVLVSMLAVGLMLAVIDKSYAKWRDIPSANILYHGEETTHLAVCFNDNP